MKPYYDEGGVAIYHGDCRDVLPHLDPVALCLTDPPYGLEFMGKDWDRLSGARIRQPSEQDRSSDRAHNTTTSLVARNAPEAYVAGPRMQEWHEAWAREALRVLKPGGHLLAFGGTRTYHRLTCAVEDAGFEIRDCIAWMYGSGFPKSLDVSKAIDKAAGGRRTVEREGRRSAVRPFVADQSKGKAYRLADDASTTAPATPEAERWNGWGTALKPAHEPIVVARKPLVGTVAGNVLAHGTGALNIDGCRVGTGENWDGDARPYAGRNGYGPDDSDGWDGNWTKRSESHAAGRWPANVVLDEDAAAMLDEQSGNLAPGNHPSRRSGRFDEKKVYGSGWTTGTYGERRATEAGGASRFFYCAKASRRERGEGNTHPTVKPLALMRWLVRLAAPPGGVVLDPFAGSGSTLIAARDCGMLAVGTERDERYCEIAAKRLSASVEAAA